jgi:hypothetical protein
MNLFLKDYYYSLETDDSESIDKKQLLSDEHIIPKSYEKHYAYMLNQYSPEFLNKVIQFSIGNRMLLMLKANKKIGNKDINEKISIYEKSKFVANKLFIDRLKNNSIYDNLVDNVIKRNEEIINFIGEYYNIGL